MNQREKVSCWWIRQKVLVLLLKNQEKRSPVDQSEKNGPLLMDQKRVFPVDGSKMYEILQNQKTFARLQIFFSIKKIRLLPPQKLDLFKLFRK